MPIILDGTKGETFPSWTTGTRPATPNTGQTGYNTTLNTLEVYDGTNWRQNYLNSATAQASTSGTSIDFTSIPSWVKRITLMYSGVSTNGSSLIRIQLGDAGGIETSGYTATAYYVSSTPAAIAALSSTSGFDSLGDATAASIRDGWFQLVNISSNTWILNGTYCVTGNAVAFNVTVAGSKATSATLDRVRITTVNGTDTFDAGSINILYE